jgi:hypothetical protein
MTFLQFYVLFPVHIHFSWKRISCAISWEFNDAALATTLAIIEPTRVRVWSEMMTFFLEARALCTKQLSFQATAYVQPSVCRRVQGPELGCGISRLTILSDHTSCFWFRSCIVICFVDFHCITWRILVHTRKWPLITLSWVGKFYGAL